MKMSEVGRGARVFWISRDLRTLRARWRTHSRARALEVLDLWNKLNADEIRLAGARVVRLGSMAIKLKQPVVLPPRTTLLHVGALVEKKLLGVMLYVELVLDFLRVEVPWQALNPETGEITQVEPYEEG